MIHDSLEKAHIYESIHPRFKKAFEFLRKIKNQPFNEGKILIENENIYAIISLNKGLNPEESKIEAHRKYIDIQMPLSKTEKMGWRSLEHLSQIAIEYNEEKDILFFEEKASHFISVEPGEFVIFFPQDGHQPCVTEGDIKKVVVKILI
jgi:YhcH/YjgK/YiaL family protein